MPRKNGNLEPLSSGSRGIGRAIYRNKLDTLNTILSPGYFNDDWTLLRDIDFMDIVAADGSMAARLSVGTRLVLLQAPETASTARRLLAAARSPLGDLSAVMASPPTITDPVTDGANSTVQTAQTVSAGMFLPSDPTRVSLFGGPISTGAFPTGGRIQTLTRTTGAMFMGHSAGIAFYTDAPLFDVVLRCNGARWSAYVTDTNGVRARISATDRVQAFANQNYYKIDFGSAAPGGRLVEIYLGQGSNFGGINVPTGYSIWPAPLSQQPKLGALWDSFGDAVMNDATLNLKLGTMDWFAGVFGCNNPHVNALASTGTIATNGGANYLTFVQRLQAGDMDASRIGNLDLIFAPGSVNDGLIPPGGIASPAGDATVQAAYQAEIALLRERQPRAIIVGASQQFNTVAAIASRTAAYRAGFFAAAANDNRCIWIDGSLFESAPSLGVIGADNVHPASVYGSRQIGERIGRMILPYLTALAA